MLNDHGLALLVLDNNSRGTTTVSALAKNLGGGTGAAPARCATISKARSLDVVGLADNVADHASIDTRAVEAPVGAIKVGAGGGICAHRAAESVGAGPKVVEATAETRGPGHFGVGDAYDLSGHGVTTYKRSKP